MSFTIMLLLCICNYSYTAEELFYNELPPLTDTSEYIDLWNTTIVTSSSSICAKETRSPKRKKRRSNISRGRYEHLCSHCNKCMNCYDSVFDKHNATQHTICSICSPEKPFLNRTELALHIEEDHAPAPAWLQALNNATRFTTSTAVANKFTYKDSVKLDYRHCNFCDHIFKYTFQRTEFHMATAHKQCIRCSRSSVI